MVRGHARGAALAPVVRIKTSRRVLGLLDGAGQTLAEVAADHVAAQPAGGSASWEEIEAELVTGGHDLLTAIDTQLRRAGARHAATATKLQRALAGQLPAAGAAPEPPLTVCSAAGQVVLGYVRDQVAAITRYDPLVRRDEPDAVHQSLRRPTTDTAPPAHRRAGRGDADGATVAGPGCLDQLLSPRWRWATPTGPAVPHCAHGAWFAREEGPVGRGPAGGLRPAKELPGTAFWRTGGGHRATGRRVASGAEDHDCRTA